MDMRERILEGFRKLSFTVGFHAATVDDLSAATGISKRTVYKYFKSKDDLINAVIGEMLAATQNRVDAVLGSSLNPVEKIIESIRLISQNSETMSPAIMRDLQRYYPHIWARIEEVRTQKVRQFIEMISAGCDQGHFRKTDPRVFTAALMASIREVINPGFIVENNLTLEKAVQSLFHIFLYGIVSGDSIQQP